jgi:hypothetical protein
MAIYLGSSGHVELQRDSLNVPLHSELNPDDVNEARRRFSFDFPHGALITGDKVEIRTEDGSNLQLVGGHPFPDWSGFIGVDDAGGVSLYRTFADALNNDRAKALALTAPMVSQVIAVRSRQNVSRCLASISSYEITTSRETIDLTSLGEEFRRSYAGGLMSGQGTLSCLWRYKGELCGGEGQKPVEFPHYLAQLCLRTQQGASFVGRFYLDTSVAKEFLWYEATCIVTNVATSFEPGQAVRSQIQFVTTGPVALHMGQPPGYLLQENGNLLLQEDGSALLLEDP